MSVDSALILGRDLVAAADHSQIYIYSSALPSDDSNPFLEALADAMDSRRFVGAVTGLVDLMTPGQWNPETPVRLEVWSAEPPSDTTDWDHEVDTDLDVPDGRLWLAASGGGRELSTEIPPGSYRIRVSGRGLNERGSPGVPGNDSYRLRLWPTTAAREPLLRKRWPGWNHLYR